jgi:hypothetical protein
MVFQYNSQKNLGYTYVKGMSYFFSNPIDGSFTTSFPGLYKFTAVGGGGGDGYYESMKGGRGGKGAIVTLNLTLDTGSVVHFSIGGGGSHLLDGGGTRCASGGGGGGLTQVQIGKVFLIAGGGGGGGTFNGSNTDGGDGGQSDGSGGNGNNGYKGTGHGGNADGSGGNHSGNGGHGGTFETDRNGEDIPIEEEGAGCGGAATGQDFIVGKGGTSSGTCNLKGIAVSGASGGRNGGGQGGLRDYDQRGGRIDYGGGGGAGYGGGEGGEWASFGTGNINCGGGAGSSYGNTIPASSTLVPKYLLGPFNYMGQTYGGPEQNGCLLVEWTTSKERDRTNKDRKIRVLFKYRR